MKTTRQVACLTLVVVLLISIQFIGFVSADDGIKIIPSSPNAVNIEGVGIIEQLFHFLSQNKYVISDIVIQRRCDIVRTGSQRFVELDQTVSLFVPSACTSGHALIQAFSKLNTGSSLFLKVEFKDNGELACPSRDPQGNLYPNKEKCVVEFYCCSTDECSSNSNCADWRGPGSQCQTKNYVSFDNFMQISKYFVNGVQATTYKACSAPTCTPDNSCKANTCVGATCMNTCTQAVSGTKTCPSGQTCSDGVCSGSNTCKQNGEYYCYSDSDCCSGYCRDSTLHCEASPTCTPDCTSAGHCGGASDGCTSTCPNACPGTPCSGNNACRIPSNNCAGTQTCSGGVLGDCIQDDASCGITPDPDIKDAGCDGGAPDGVCSLLEWDLGWSGTACKADCESRDILNKVTIIKMSYGGLDGKPLAKLTPGQMIQVDFDIKAEVPWNINPYMVEAGIIPLSTATLWEMNKASGGFSIFDTFAVGASDYDSCCKGQPNVADNSYDFKSWISSTTVQHFSYKLQVPDQDTKDICAAEENRAPNLYWDPVEKEYVLYVIVKNGCTKYGYRKNVFMTKAVELDLNATSSFGQKCTNDFDCEVGETCQDIVGDWSSQKYCAPLGGIMSNKTVIKKFPMTREEISKSTSGDLIASACYGKGECQDRINYTASCIPVSALVKDGTMSNIQQKDLFSDAKGVITMGGIGGGIGVTLCAIGAVGAPASFGATALVGCGVGGALLLVSMTQLISKIPTSELWTPELQNAITSGDSAKVGICTAEPVTQSFDIGGTLCSVGKTIKITGDCTMDGLFVIIGGIFLVIILMNMMNGGKK